MSRHPRRYGSTYGFSEDQVFPIYNHLAEFRAAHGLSRKELAEDVRMNHRIIDLLENGYCESGLREAFRISRYFGLPLELVFSTEPLAVLPKPLPGLKRPHREEESLHTAPGSGSLPRTDQRSRRRKLR